MYERGDIKYGVDRARVKKSTKMGKYLYERDDIRSTVGRARNWEVQKEHNDGQRTVWKKWHEIWQSKTLRSKEMHKGGERTLWGRWHKIGG